MLNAKDVSMKSLLMLWVDVVKMLQYFIMHNIIDLIIDNLIQKQFPKIKLKNFQY